MFLYNITTNKCTTKRTCTCDEYVIGSRSHYGPAIGSQDIDNETV